MWILQLLLRQVMRPLAMQPQRFLFRPLIWEQFLNQQYKRLQLQRHQLLPPLRFLRIMGLMP
jgi:hypothetical protein